MDILHDWLPIGISLMALIFTAVTFIRASHRETGEQAMERATMIADLRYIRQAIEDMKVESKVLKEDMRTMDLRLTSVEASTASAHKRMDEMIKALRGEGGLL